MKNEYKLLFPFVVCCVLFSCVSSDRYKELVQVKDYLEAENKRLTSQDEENRNLRSNSRQQKLELDQAQGEIVELETSFNSLNRNYQDLTNRYNTLINNNKQVGSGGASEKQYYEEELAKKQLEIEDKNRQIQTLRYTIDQKEKRVQELLQMVRANQGN